MTKRILEVLEKIRDKDCVGWEKNEYLKGKLVGFMTCISIIELIRLRNGDE